MEYPFFRVCVHFFTVGSTKEPMGNFGTPTFLGINFIENAGLTKGVLWDNTNA